MDMAELVSVEGVGEFFAPTSSDMVDGLVGQYRAMRARIEQIAETVTGETAGALGYFLSGNGRDDRYGAPSVERLFRVEGAVAALNSAYWSKALALTDVLDCMPQKRRDEWFKSIDDKTAPDFTDETVRATISDLLAMRAQFFAERVDGIFGGLSGEHVTNSPVAFGKRMIVGYVLSEWGGENHSKCGLINDLRCVIAKFMGRDEPSYNATSRLIRTLKGRWGEWVSVDGGALKVRLYKKGTAHIEVHPDMAWRLNMVLAHIYPMAIPPEFRQKPKRKPKDVPLIMRPLPFAVVELLGSVGAAYDTVKTEDFRHPFKKEEVRNALDFGAYTVDQAGKHVRAEAEAVLESLGGVKVSEFRYQFDYDPHAVLEEIVVSGCIPDQKAFQFYPTPESVAKAAVELAEIGDGHTCLEPSAGTGALVSHMPADRTRCIEVSQLRCNVLSAKGLDVTQADFLEWAGVTYDRFDRIVMNPPFDQGRWKAHLEAAAGLLTSDGRLVAVLPVSAKGKDLLPGLKCSYPRTFDNEFAGTSVSVAILVAEAA